ncbi:uncharacterized protein PG986_010086 [Apiospora aurea]|uniref:Tify domain-containing protein n=1 Tax=Apiospora aurea TaxID=335848 RepID=A0ABR1Q9L0_9PEZI
MASDKFASPPPPPKPAGSEQIALDRLPTFEVEWDGHPCRLVVRVLLTPDRAEIKHAADCQESGQHVRSDADMIKMWIFYMGTVCLHNGLVTEQQANAIMDMSGLNTTPGFWWSYRGPAGREKTLPEDDPKEGSPFVLDIDMFRAAMGATVQPMGDTKIIKRGSVPQPVARQRPRAHVGVLDGDGRPDHGLATEAQANAVIALTRPNPKIW